MRVLQGASVIPRRVAIDDTETTRRSRRAGHGTDVVKTPTPLATPGMVRMVERHVHRPRRGSPLHLLGVVCLVVLLVPLGGPPGDAAHPTWEQPRSGDGSGLFAITSSSADALWAVGHHGRILTGNGATWAEAVTPTDRHLHDVAFASPTKGLAVGERGIILGYGPHWGTPGPYPAGAASVAGTSGSGTTEERRVEFRLPLDVVGIGAGSIFGLGVVAEGAAAEQSHPSDLDEPRPGTTAPVRFDDVVRGTPAVDGEREAMWAPAVHAQYTSGAVPFSVHLLRDTAALYVLVAGQSSLTGVRLQLHQVHHDDASVGDTRYRHPLDGSPTHATTGPPDWAVHRAADALTSADLHGVAWLDATTPLVVGSGGTALVRKDGIWSPLATGTSRTLFGVDTRDGEAYAAGAAPDRMSGAVIVKTDGTSVSALSIPAGTYGLSAIDLDACRAVGSAGTVLGCDGGDPSRWLRSVVDPESDLRGIAHDATSGTTWLTGAASSGTAALYQSDANGWSARHLPVAEGLLAAAYTTGRDLYATALDGDLHLLSPHPPVFEEIPDELVAHQGVALSFKVRGVDRDNDVLFLDLHKRPGLPYPDGIRQYDDGHGDWTFEWVPSYDAPPQVAVDVRISDGKDNTSEGIDFIVIDANGPPVWDPHPDVTIAHSWLWTTYVRARDPDHDPLSLSALALPGGAVFDDLGGGHGRIDWTPTAGQLGDHSTTLNASDGTLTADLTFQITVVSNRPPIIDSISPNDPILCVQGPWWPGTLTLSASAHDPDGTDVSYSWTFHDDGTTVNGSKVQHTYSATGTEYATLTVTDGHGVQNSTTIRVRVDDCVHVEASLDDGCISPFSSTASGRLTMYDHTGEITTGDYEVAVWWDGTHGPRQRNVVTGTISGANTTFHVPYDLAPLPINELWRHDVFVKGLKRNTLFGDTEWDTMPLFYDVSPLCDLPRIPAT